MGYGIYLLSSGDFWTQHPAPLRSVDTSVLRGSPDLNISHLMKGTLSGSFEMMRYGNFGRKLEAEFIEEFKIPEALQRKLRPLFVNEMHREF